MTPDPVTAPLPAEAARRAHARAGAARWGVSLPDFAAALERSVTGRFGSRWPSPPDVAACLESLHVADLALAVACAAGHDGAWAHFVREFRPILLRVAARHAPPDAAHDVADSLYADLFGTTERDGRRRSLFDYYHGRCTLAGWLKAVVAQRLVDRAREARRVDPLPEPGTPAEPASPPDLPDVDRDRLLPIVQREFRVALDGLDARDRLRLGLYYGRSMTLAAIGRLVGESEATVSRKLAQTRKDVRQSVEAALRARGLGDAAIRQSLDLARTDPAFDVARDLGG